MLEGGLIHEKTSEAIIKSFYHVYNTLGYGFLKKVYENSMRVSLEKLGYAVNQQFPIDVIFEGEHVGKYFADLLVANKVVVELKAAKAISPDHEAQLLNYLKATGLQVGLLLNFGTKAEFRRKVFSSNAT